ncbi:MAG: hypothetical protein IJN69_01930 [Oscillospiraceae bacterium]|nr:hypothetical protein [Oscillospiraceae bacterium]
MNSMEYFDDLAAFEQKFASEIKKDYMPEVSEKEIISVCETAAFYYTEKQDIFDRKFWKVIFSCITVQSAFMWILSAFLLGCCVVLSTVSSGYGIEPVSLICALAPVPVISFAIRELQYRDSNLVALEKTCKYAPQRIYFARLWLGMAANVVWLLLTGAAVFCQNDNFIRLYICSFVCLFLVGAVALVVMSVSDSTLPLSLMMAAWVLTAVFLLSNEEFVQIIASVSLWLLTAIMIISIGMFAAVTVKTTTKMYA